MKKPLFILVLSILTLDIMAQNTADKNEISAVISKFNNSWNKHNFQNLGSYATKELYYISPVAEEWKSLDSVQQWLHTMHQSSFKTRPWEEQKRDIRFLAKDVAIATLVVHIGAPSGMDTGGYTPSHEHQLRTMTLIKQNNKWLLAVMQSTIIPPPTIK